MAAHPAVWVGLGVSQALGALFFFQAEDGIRDATVTGVQTCALPIFAALRCALAGYLGHRCILLVVSCRGQLFKRKAADRATRRVEPASARDHDRPRPGLAG